MAGMTLLEMTVVILVLLSLITVLFFGAQAWKRGSDRALCIIHIQNVQKGVRSYSNLYGFSPGGNAPNLQSQVIGFGRFIESTPVCPGSGSYTFGQTYGADTVPPMGSLYMECSLAISDQHIPDVTSDW
jgi:type II secretory pathway pseudopilin PulG